MIPGYQPGCDALLDEYRRFRHVVRNVYAESRSAARGGTG